MQGTALLVGSEKARGEAIAPLKGLFEAFVEVSAPGDGLKAFVEERPSFIIVIDEDMQPSGGLAFVSAARETGEGGAVPALVIFGAGAKVPWESLSGGDGWTDFIKSPYEDGELAARICALLRLRNLADESNDRKAIIERGSFTDGLTGLLNRAGFFRAAGGQLFLCSRHSLRFALILLDLDGLDGISEAWGASAAGDVIKKAGEILRFHSRGGEIAARFGGEEFALALFNTSVKGALSAAERFSSLVRSFEFRSADYPSLRLTVSSGVSITGDGCYPSIDELLKTADQALYRAKRGGRDRISISECPPSRRSSLEDVELSRQD